MLPKDIRLDPIPFAGTFGRSEAEVAAAWIVAGRTVDNRWDNELTIAEMKARTLAAYKSDARVQQIVQNPFLRPDFMLLHNDGYITDGFIFTEKAMEKLKAFVEVAP